jgi:hypothetical protein
LIDGAAARSKGLAFGVDSETSAIVAVVSAARASRVAKNKERVNPVKRQKEEEGILIPEIKPLIYEICQSRNP